MNKKRIKIVYFGTADFAVPPLQALLNQPAIFEIVGVVSQPDRPAGRKNQPKISPVATIAREKDLVLFQPEKLDKNAIQTLKELKADLFVVAAYGLILPKIVLTIPPGGAINLHGSLLPKYRGASPIQTAILNGETKTGVTLILMDEKMDHGPIIDSAQVTIDKIDDYQSLTKKLSEAAANLLVETAPKYIAGKINPWPQEHATATYTERLKKEYGRINWQTSAFQIERQIRAFSPWPGIFTKLNDRRIKILTIEISTDKTASNTIPGTITTTKNRHPQVATADYWIKLIEVQPEGKKPISGRDFLHGYPNSIHFI
ncbi:methionyl-tRNA formyltransferase [Patescibacteria group bacterium]|nr:methionyl-tRNA formyltransferase [Patescibacteria group bacterium]